MINRMDSAAAAVCLTLGGGFFTGAGIAQLGFAGGDQIVQPWIGVFGVLGAVLCGLGAFLHHKSLR